jgi:putative PIN family toxin of toxin-antitoxin system
MKIVLDANIVISAFLWAGIPRAITKRVADGLDTLFVTNEIIYEIEEVIVRPKFSNKQEKAKSAIEFINYSGQKVIVAQKITTGGCRDNTDNKYLECAVAGNADYIISGDIHLLELKKYGDVKIVTAREYIEIVSQNVSHR